MTEEMKKVNDENLDAVAGGVGVDYVHDLNNFVYRTVANLLAGTYLVMQAAPGGAFLSQSYVRSAQCKVTQRSSV